MEFGDPSQEYCLDMLDSFYGLTMLCTLMVRLKSTDLVGKQKQKYRGMFETQKSGNKTSSGEICLNIRTIAGPKVGQGQVSGGVSVLCLHAAPVANILWKPLAIK